MRLLVLFDNLQTVLTYYKKNKKNYNLNITSEKQRGINLLFQLSAFFWEVFGIYQ